MADKFDRFTERARQVLTLAQQEAQTRGQNTIGTEHFLLALVRQDDSTAARVLANLGVRPPQVRTAVEARIGRGGSAPPGEIGLTPRARRVIELAVDEARRLNHHYIGTEHLLLGLIREGEGIAAGVLASMGVGLEQVRAQIIAIVAASPGSAPAGRDATGPGTVGPLPGAWPGQPADVVRVPLDPLAGLVATAAGALAHLLATRRGGAPGEAPRPPERLAALRAALLTGLGAAILPAARAAVEAARAGRRPFDPRPGGGWRGRIVRRGRPAPPPPPDPRAVQGSRSALGTPGGVRIEPVGPPRGPRGPITWSATVEPPHAAPPRPAPPRPRPAPLGDLVRVVPVAQTQRQGAIEVAITALELYADGFMVNVQVRGAGDDRPAREVPDQHLLAGDDRGGRYQTQFGGGTGDNDPGHWRWRLTYQGTPALDPAARELRLEATGPRRQPPGPAAPEPGLGPWRCTIPLGDGQGAGEAGASGKP